MYDSYLYPCCPVICWTKRESICKCLLGKTLQYVLCFGYQLLAWLLTWDGWVKQEVGRTLICMQHPLCAWQCARCISDRAAHSVCTTTLRNHPLHLAGKESLSLESSTNISLRGKGRPKPCPLCSLRRHLPVFCLQSCAPQPAPGTHGHHWSAVHVPGCAGRCPPGGLGGCLRHCQPLSEGNNTEIYCINVGGGWLRFSMTLTPGHGPSQWPGPEGVSTLSPLGRIKPEKVSFSNTASCFLLQGGNFV